MAVQTNQTIVPTPQPESSTGQFVGLYTLTYRHNSNSLQSKNFRFNGSLKEARARAEVHCDIMGYRFHWVQPLICDFRKEEDYLLGRTSDTAGAAVQAQQEVQK